MTYLWTVVGLEFGSSVGRLPPPVAGLSSAGLRSERVIQPIRRSFENGTKTILSRIGSRGMLVISIMATSPWASMRPRRVVGGGGA